MILEEKLKAFKEKGWTYNKDTGEVFSHTGNTIRGKDGHGYIFCRIRIDGKNTVLFAHQLAWYLSTGEVPNIVDHINRNRTDNRIVNLRSITPQQNTFNTDAKGYSWNTDRNKYQARIRINGKLQSLGVYDNETDANQAYLNAKEIYHKI